MGSPAFYHQADIRYLRSLTDALDELSRVTGNDVRTVRGREALTPNEALVLREVCEAYLKRRCLRFTWNICPGVLFVFSGANHEELR
jgi:hypothetical protein